MRINVAGETLVLLAERAIFWPARRTLVVADLHWGKAASFRAHGIPVPAGTTAADLDRLEGALAHSGATRLLVLGDLLHARAAREARGTQQRIAEWRSRRPDLTCLLVRGNHDQAAGDPPASLGFQVANQLHEGPFVFQHHPAHDPRGYVLAGHLHPSVRLTGPGDRLRLPCFYFGRGCGILPAFGSFTGTATLDVAPGDRIYVIGDGTVHEIPVDLGGGIAEAGACE